MLLMLDIKHTNTSQVFIMKHASCSKFYASSLVYAAVSAMANANGGLLIYGIEESNHIPQKITPIDRNKFSKEWLEQVINSSISPKIEDLKIISISVDNPDSVVYVIEVPQ